MFAGPFFTLIYSLTAMILLVGYVPQIVLLAQAGEKDRRISVSSLGIWLALWTFCLAYGFTVLHDWRFCAVAGINVAGHALLMGLILLSRHVRFVKAKPVS